jgi:hypothetical protein
LLFVWLGFDEKSFFLWFLPFSMQLFLRTMDEWIFAVTVEKFILPFLLTSDLQFFWGLLNWLRIMRIGKKIKQVLRGE